MKMRWQPKTVGEKMRSHVFRNGTVCYIELLNYVACLSLKQIFWALPLQESLLFVPAMSKGQCITMYHNVLQCITMKLKWKFCFYILNFIVLHM